MQLKTPMSVTGLCRIPAKTLSKRLAQAIRPLGLTLTSLTAKVGRPSFRRTAGPGTGKHGRSVSDVDSEEDAGGCGDDDGNDCVDGADDDEDSTIVV